MMDWQRFIDKRLSAARVAHSKRVAESAMMLARHYNISVEAAEVAGWLHDYAKNLSGRELLEIAESEHLIRYECERALPQILHGVVGAFLLNEAHIVTDKQILTAIERHTTGSPHMSTLDKIIYLADYIEPGRRTPGVEKIREIAYYSLDEALILCLQSTMCWLIEKRSIIHPNAIHLWNELQSSDKIN